MTPDRDPLDDLLAPDPYLEDAGFTGRVLASLPRRRRDPRPWVLATSLAVAAVIGAAAFPALLGSLASLRAALAGSMPALPGGAGLLATAGAALAGLAASGAAWIATRD